MKKMFLLLLCIAGSAGVSGQTMRFQFATDTIQGQIAADSSQRIDPTTLQLRGSVQIVVGTVIITADEADIRTTVGPDGSAGIDLRGNVHLTMKPSK